MFLWRHCQYIRLDLPVEVLGNVFSVIANWIVKMYISTLPQQINVNRATNVCNDILQKSTDVLCGSAQLENLFCRDYNNVDIFTFFMRAFSAKNKATLSDNFVLLYTATIGNMQSTQFLYSTPINSLAVCWFKNNAPMSACHRSPCWHVMSCPVPWVVVNVICRVPTEIL